MRNLVFIIYFVEDVSVTFANLVINLALTEIQYLQIEPSEKGTNTNKSLMLKMFFLCADSSDKQSAFDGL